MKYTVNHEAVYVTKHSRSTGCKLLLTAHALPFLSTIQHDIKSTNYEFILMHFS